MSIILSTEDHDKFIHQVFVSGFLILWGFGFVGGTLWVGINDLGMAYNSSTRYVGFKIFASTGTVVIQNNSSIYSNTTKLNILYGSSWNQTYVGGFNCDLYRTEDIDDREVPISDLKSSGYHIGDNFLVLVSKQDINKCFLPSDLEDNFILGIFLICTTPLIILFIINVLRRMTFETKRNYEVLTTYAYN